MKDLPQPPPSDSPGGKIGARLTIVESVYQQHGTVGIVAAVESRSNRWLKSDQRAFVDEFTTGNTWQTVSFGRLKSIGMIVIENLAGNQFTVVPTPEERERVAGLEIEVAFLPKEGGYSGQDLQPTLRVQPGESSRFQVVEGMEIHLRCTRGEAPCLITTIPD